MMYSITVFKNQFDNRTNKILEFDSWSGIEELLYDLSKRPGVKGGDDTVPLISPARFEWGKTRANAHVDYWASWCCVDVDKVPFEVTDKIDLRNQVEAMIGDYYFLCYSTASSKLEHPKFRLVFPLTTIVKADDIPHFWFALNSEIEGIGDKQTKDLARMFYIPAQYPDAFNFFFRHKANVMDPDLLMEKWPYVEPTGNSFMDKLPENVRKQIEEYKRAKLTNTHYTWSGYSDCPFWPKKLEKEYRQITETGWYHMMYQIMVAIGFKAVKRGYPITAAEIDRLVTEFDKDTGGWYANRPIRKEADRALEYVYRNS